jgi:hypothetical protein
MRIAQPALAASILLALAGPAASQNLVTNAHFDTNVNSWNPWVFSPGGVLVWSPLDWAGDPSSGSALLTNVSAVAGENAVRISNCITLPTTGIYEFGAHVRIPGGQASSGQAAIVPILWDLPGCNGFAASLIVPGTTVTTATTDVWVPILALLPPLNAGTQMQLSLRVRKDQAGGTLSTHFDFARFGLEGTTPVELLAFEIE